MVRFTLTFALLLVAATASAQAGSSTTASPQAPNLGAGAVVQGDSAAGAQPILGTGVPGTPSPGAPTLRMALPEKKKGTPKEGPAPSRPQ